VTVQTPLKVLVVDDEPLARARMQTLLERLEQVIVVAQASDGYQALTACTQYQPDVVLLDISMPGMDGMETAQHINQLQPRPLVVFCTAYDQHALSAFEAAALDYLVKPVRVERLSAALARARMFVAGRQAIVTADQDNPQPLVLHARMGTALRLIPIDSIFYLLAGEKYVSVYHSRGEELIEQSLRSVEEQWSEHFFRIHRNCLVSRQKLLEIRQVTGGKIQAIVHGVSQPLRVSRRCLSLLKKTIPVNTKAL